MTNDQFNVMNDIVNHKNDMNDSFAHKADGLLVNAL